MNWMKYRLLYFALSLLVIIPGIYSLAKNGLNLSIEFTGGSHFTLNSVSQDYQAIEESFKDLSPSLDSQSENNLTIKTKTISQEELIQKIDSLKEHNPDLSLSEFETIRPSLGQETVKKTITGIILAALAILTYVSFSFKKLKFGVCAILAMFHDTFILLGSYSLLGHYFNFKADLLFVTAVLTILSFSVHDTIVVYDRVRELTKKNPTKSQTEIINRAVTDTIIRSLNNSLTIIFMLIALVLMGAGSIKNFALALLIGTITGTYSSTFTAAPLLVVWENIFRKKN